MPPRPPAILLLDFDAVAQQLIGHWLHDTGDSDLYPAYERLLAAAQAHSKCRFWLLDMRQRSWRPASFALWMSDLLAKKVVRELGSPVFVAYVADESLRTTSLAMREQPATGCATTRPTPSRSPACPKPSRRPAFAHSAGAFFL